MEDTRTSRAKWVSRTLAVISALIGIKISLGSIKFLLRSSIPQEPVSFLIEFIMIVLAVSTCSFLFWLTVQLWTHVEQKHIKSWALMPALLVFLTIGSWTRTVVEQAMLGLLPDSDVGWFASEVSSFVALLAGGLAYWGVKRLLFYLLQLHETIVFTPFQNSRKAYFWWLSFFLFGIFISATASITINLRPGDQPWFPFAAFLLPLVAAVVFYKICVHLFITKPLKAMEQTPA